MIIPLSQRQIQLVATGTVLALASLGATAQNTTVQTKTLNAPNFSLTDSTGPAFLGGRVAESRLIGPYTTVFDQFNSNTGVLVGASFVASYTATPTLQLTDQGTGTGSYLETISGAGFSTRQSSAYATKSNPTTVTKAFSGFGGTVTQTGNALSNFVGGGAWNTTYGGSINADLTSFGPSNPNNKITASLTSTGFTHGINQTLTYNWLGHANASFASGLNMNELAITAGSSFSVYALGDANTTLLDQITSWTCSGALCGDFSLNWSNISDKLAGSSAAIGSVTSVGHRAGTVTYTANFGDNSAVGLAATRFAGDQLVLTVTEVPEPGSMALFLAGIAALGAVSRRRSLSK